MLKILKTAFKHPESVGDHAATAAANHARFGVRGRPVHNVTRCLACGACAVACPCDAIRMETDTRACTLTWSLDLARCIFCGRCEEMCPFDAIRLGDANDLAACSRDDLVDRAVFTVSRCRICGRPFAPAREIDYARNLLTDLAQRAAQAGGAVSAEVSADVQAALENVDVCLECKRIADARAADVAANAKAGAQISSQVTADDRQYPERQQSHE